MLNQFLKAKIYPLVITEKIADCEGSLGLPKSILEAAGLSNREKVLVVNQNNGIRYETYIIAQETEGVVSIHGTGGRYSEIGDKLMVLTWQLATPDELIEIRTVKVTSDNKVLTVKIDGIKEARS